MATCNFNIENVCYALTTEQSNDFFDYEISKNQDCINNGLDCPSYILKEFGNVKVVITGGYYEGASFDYVVDETPVADVIDTLLYDNIARPTKKDIIEAIDYDNNDFVFNNKITIKGKTTIKYIEELISYSEKINTKKAIKYIKSLSKEWGAIELNVVGRFSNGETIYSKK